MTIHPNKCCLFAPDANVSKQVLRNEENSGKTPKYCVSFTEIRVSVSWYTLLEFLGLMHLSEFFCIPVRCSAVSDY
jgi:hypothetical protein